MSRCLICNGRANSREHYIPRWLAQATGRESDELVGGLAREGLVVRAASRGSSRTAVQYCLCRKCNVRLGATLEADAMRTMTPLVSINATSDRLQKAVNGMDSEARNSLTFWSALRAMQFFKGYLAEPMPEETARSLTDGLRKIMAEEAPALPAELSLDFAWAPSAEFQWQITRQIRERSGLSFHAEGSFMLGVQLNHLLLLLAHIPAGAFPDRSRGWGMAVHPLSKSGSVSYSGITEMMNSCRIMLWNDTVQQVFDRLASERNHGVDGAQSN